MKIGDCHIGFIGFGHMAKVMFQAMDLAKLIPRSQVFFIQRDTHTMRDNEKLFGITSSSLKNIVDKSQVLILGVRPGQVEQVLQDLTKFDLKNKMLITVVAGRSISSYQKQVGSEMQIVRVMPNIASLVGEGMSVLSFGKNVTSEFKSFTKLFFSCMGEVMELGEEFMDISCGIAGSGPGFVFRLIEAMARAGEKGGLPYSEALKMSAQVFKGAAQLILKGSSPQDLVHQIAVPGGTTEAGFRVMEETSMGKSLQRVVEASAHRSKELAQVH